MQVYLKDRRLQNHGSFCKWQYCCLWKQFL